MSPPRLKITAIRTFLMQAGPLGASAWGDVSTSVITGTRNWCFVKVETDAGITGIGEGSGWPRVVEAGLRDLAPLLIGEDPFDTERINQKLQVAIMGHGITGVVGLGAIGAIDMALWDIKGKALGVPVWQLLGGKTRDRIRAYAHASTPEQAKAAVAKGYTALKTGGVADPVQKAFAIREAVGDEVDIMIDLHGPPWLTLPDAIAYCNALAPLAPLFVEEPLAPEDIAGYRRLREKTEVPLASGERHGGLHGVGALLMEGLIDVAQPDTGRAGGLTQLRKIAAVAEAGFATLAPHAGSLGPVAEFAALHLLAAIPNALILEKMDPDWPGRAQTVTATPELRDGCLMIPDAPGLGVDIDEEFVAAHPSVRNVGLAKGGWPEGTEGATLYIQPRHPRRRPLRPKDFAPVNEDTRQKLAAVSTATLTTALFKRGFRNLFLQGPRRVNPDAPAMVGPAYTLRYIPAREDLDRLDAFLDADHPQRKGVEECPPGAVFVIDSRGDASAASAGGILLTRLMRRGVAGAVTDGGFRDSPEIARMPWPVFHAAPSAPTNLIKHHAVDLNVPIACGGVGVYPGDIMVGDGEGVVCVPAHLADELAAETWEQTIFEDFVQERVDAGHTIRGLYPMTDAANRPIFEAWRKAKGR